MELTNDDVKRFAALYSGYQKAYGTYLVRGNDPTGKAIGKAQTLRGEATLPIYQAHLEGAGSGLGIIMLREDNSLFFGAIDYDEKDMDHVKAEAQVRLLELPLVLCRSKSGGGHFYCFTSEPVPASVMRDRLAEWTALLGMSTKTENFPKQSARYNENDIGNWINIPYFHADQTNRYAIHEGRQLTLQEFLNLAESKRQTLEQLSDSNLTDNSTLFESGPPCLQTLEAQGGFVQGTKKEGMFNVGVYLRKAFPDDWQTRYDQYNAVMAKLKSEEVQALIKQVGKKAWSYKCKQPPINACCNRRVCRTRLYGIGTTDTEETRGYAIGGLIRYDSSHGDEAQFAMEVAGKRVMVNTSQLYSRDEFNRACMNQANVIPVHMTPVKWLRFLNDFLPTADIVQLPDDASPLGQLWQYVIMFLTDGVVAMEREKLLLGVPYREGDKIYFRSTDLFAYLNSRRIQYKSPQQVWELLRGKGGDKTGWMISKKFTNVWFLPAPDEYEVEQANTAVEETKEAF